MSSGAEGMGTLCRAGPQSPAHMPSEVVMPLETSSWCRTGGQITGSLLSVEENHPVELNVCYVAEGHGSVVTPSQPHLANAWRMDVCLPTVKRALGAWPEREGDGAEVRGKRGSAGVRTGV